LLVTYKVNKNLGQKPTIEVLEKHPEIVHRVERKFGTQLFFNELYQRNDWNEWYDFYSIHLAINHRWYLDKFYRFYPIFNERNIKHYPHTFGEMVRLLLQFQDSNKAS
jgi:hypothetical protein